MDGFSLNSVVDSIGGFTSTALDIVFYIVGLIILASLVYYIYFILEHKYKVEVMMNTGGKDVAINDTAKEIKGTEGTYWKLLKLKETVPAPPSEAIYLDNKGHIKARCYYSREGTFEWIDASTPEKIQGKNLYKNFDVLTTKHRSILVNQIIKAEARKKKNWKEYIPMIAGLGSIVILVVCMLIYWEEIVRPAVTIQNIQKETMKDVQQITQNLAEVTQRLDKIMEKANIEIPIDRLNEAPS